MITALSNEPVWLKVFTENNALVLRIDLNALDLSDPVQVLRVLRELREAKARAK